MNNEKKVIRERILQLLRNQKEEDRRRKSLVILEEFFSLPELQTSTTILFYASFDGEVDTFPMMARAQQLGKTIALPTILAERKEIIPVLVQNLKDDLEEGPYGIQQPRVDKNNQCPLTSIDMVVVPGVAFDRKKNRLGRGAGYYDRLLKCLPPGIPTVGLAFDFQVVEHLPVGAHDAPVSRLIAR